MSKNFGDDLFLKILFDKFDKVTWVLNTNNEEYKSMFKSNNVSIFDSKILKILRKFGLQKYYYKSFDALVFIGGSIFMQYDFWEKQLEDRKKLIDLFSGKNKYILGANFGPFYSNEFVDVYKEIFKNFNDVCFRDQYSYNLFKDLENIRVEPDIVFQIKPKRIKKDKNSIGISLINLEDRNELKKYTNLYNQKIKELVESLIDDGKKITFFSFCEDQGDMKSINKVISLLGYEYTKNIEVENYDGNIDEFLTKYESMENIIASRFHACILSQVFGQGLYPLIYSDKTYNVLSDIGLNKEYTYINNIEKLDANHVIDILDKNKIYDQNVFKRAEKQFDGLEKYING